MSSHIQQKMLSFTVSHSAYQVQIFLLILCSCSFQQALKVNLVPQAGTFLEYGTAPM